MIVYCTPCPSKYKARPSKNSVRKAKRYGQAFENRIQPAVVARKVKLVSHGLNTTMRDAMLSATKGAKAQKKS